jgi:tetratricopeptide (TPR) repeat protein
MDKNKLIEAAAKLVQKGAYDKAIKEYQKVLDMDPRDVRVLQKMGELYQKKNENGLAATFFSRVAETYAADGFFLKAVALYKQVLKLSPTMVQINLKLAELHQQLGLISEAMAYFQIVANHHDKMGDARSSLDTLKRMVDLDPENVTSRIKLAELYARENLREEAVAEFRHAADYLKRHNRTDDYLRVCERITALVPEDVPLARELAAYYLQRGDQKRALAKLQLCFKADPRDIDTLALLAEAFQGLGQTSKTLSVYKELAKIYAETGKEDLADQVWNKVAAIDPHDPDLAAQQSGGGYASPAAPPQQHARAVAAPPAPSRPPPASIPPRNAGSSAAAPKENLAKLLTETDVYVKYGLHDKALEHLRKVFNVDPENLDAHEKAYHIYVGSQHTVEAGEQLLNVLRLMTRRAEVERAQPYLKTVLQQNPRHPEVPAFLAVLQRQGGERAESAEDAILVESNTEDIIVGEAPEDELSVAPEDLALASNDVPEEVVEEGEVLSPEEPTGFEEEDLVEPEPEYQAEADASAELVMDAVPDPLRADTADNWEQVEDEPLISTEIPITVTTSPSYRPATPIRVATPFARPAVIAPPPPPAFIAPPPPSAPAPVAAPVARAPAAMPPARVVPPPAPAKPARVPTPPPEDPLAQEVEEAGFLIDQGLADEARDILETILLAHPDHPAAAELMQRLENAASQEFTNPGIEAPSTEQHEGFDLAAELAEEVEPVADIAIESAGDDFQYSVEEVFEEFKRGLEKVVKPEDVETHYDPGVQRRARRLVEEEERDRLSDDDGTAADDEGRWCFGGEIVPASAGERVCHRRYREESGVRIGTRVGSQRRPG